MVQRNVCEGDLRRARDAESTAPKCFACAASGNGKERDAS